MKNLNNNTRKHIIDTYYEILKQNKEDMKQINRDHSLKLRIKTIDRQPAVKYNQKDKT